MSKVSIEALEMERDKIIMDRVFGLAVDFTKLRKLCKEYQKNCDFCFKTETDKALWASVNEYLNNEIGIHP